MVPNINDHVLLTTGQGSQAELTKLINECIEQTGPKEYKLALKNPKMQEIRHKYESESKQTKVFDMPLLLAMEKWGKSFDEAKATGQLWIDEKDPNVAHWREGASKNVHGSSKDISLTGESKLSAEAAVAMHRVFDQMDKDSHRGFPGLPDATGESAPAAITDIPIQMTAAIVSKLDRSILGGETEIKSAEKTVNELTSLASLHGRGVELVEKLTAAIEDTKDNIRAMERALIIMKRYLTTIKKTQVSK
jgi:hypothetical protein